MTAAPPVPVHPRLSARVAYRVQRVLRPAAGYRWLSARIEASGALRALFTGAERQTKQALFGCRMCGQCTLPVTGYVCPMGCPKELRNGPCGGTRDGRCEVDGYGDCIWLRAYERLKHDGREQELLDHAPVVQNQGLRGTSAWANLWLGRDHNSRRKTPQAAFSTLEHEVQKR